MTQRGTTAGSSMTSSLQTLLIHLEKLYGSLGFLYFISSSFLLRQQQEVTAVSCLFNNDSGSFEEESPVLLWRLVSFFICLLFWFRISMIFAFSLGVQIKTIRKNKFYPVWTHLVSGKFSMRLKLESKQLDWFLLSGRCFISHPKGFFWLDSPMYLTTKEEVQRCQ